MEHPSEVRSSTDGKRSLFQKYRDRYCMIFPGFIYLDINHPLVAWETYRGILISANQIENDEEKHPSMMLAGMIRVNNNTRLANELLIEQIRSNEFPEKVSRLQGLFLFRDIESAQKATAWGGFFIKENLVEVDAYTEIEPKKLDANWITHLKRHNGIITEDSIDDIRKYWSGEPFDSNPCWEYLINGSIKIIGTTVRKRAYELIKKSMPTSLGFLELSRLALLLNSDLGHCIPWIRRVSPTEFELCFIMDFKDAKSEVFLKKLESYNGPKNTGDLNPTSNLVPPDLRQFFCKFKISIGNLYGYSNMKIHLCD
jgi:hypothetical protein